MAGQTIKPRKNDREKISPKETLMWIINKILNIQALLLILGLPAFADNISIPDANFKAYCIANFDTGGDGEISDTEAMVVLQNDCYDQ